MKLRSSVLFHRWWYVDTHRGLDPWYTPVFRNVSFYGRQHQRGG